MNICCQNCLCGTENPTSLSFCVNKHCPCHTSQEVAEIVDKIEQDVVKIPSPQYLNVSIEEYYKMKELRNIYNNYDDTGIANFTFDDIKLWHKNSIKELLQSQIEIVLNYTPDLCENSKEFKEYLISSLKAELEELNK